MSSVLEIQHLKFKWPRQEFDTLNITELSIKKGETLFIQGPSGSGKSTLLNVLGGVLTPNSGDISVLNTSLFKLTTGQRDKFRGDHMGFIFQTFNLLPYFSAYENVMLPCKFSKIKSEKVLNHSGSLQKEAQRLLAELKLNPEDLINKNVTELSVGQRQRVATARALMGKPEIIIADEPTSALDAHVKNSFLNLLFDECRKFQTTLIFVSHDSSLGSSFDRTISLESINKVQKNLKNEESISS